MKRKHERTGFGLLSWLALVVVLYALASVAIALATRDDTPCPGFQEREWQIVPPQWVCR